HPVAEADYFEY
nr:Chain C, Epstein-Barr nuclear antigen 1 [Epstein-barr virus strain ag876]4PRN_C Chain C, Epstein-Barr nuclear antigen 1 [Epstein-barr virus strain ag876]